MEFLARQLRLGASFVELSALLLLRLDLAPGVSILEYDFALGFVMRLILVVDDAVGFLWFDPVLVNLNLV